ncbi:MULTISPECIES: hypothetical protein [unclassified Streptomyces]|uniref:hypothetical protein n=1 Tax=Streptomyces sp. NPDC127532 TaxID=3345399 RepID=UPI0036284F98
MKGTITTTVAGDPIAVKRDAAFSITDTDGDGYANWSDVRRLVDQCLSSYEMGRNDRWAHSVVGVAAVTDGARGSRPMSEGSSCV